MTKEFNPLERMASGPELHERLATPTPLADAAAIAEREAWTCEQWAKHVGAWENADGHVCFGSWQALNAMLIQFARAALATTEATDAIAQPVATFIASTPHVQYINGYKPKTGDKLYLAPMTDAIAPTEGAVHLDEWWVDLFAKEMKSKLENARAKGRAGWQDCDPSDLSRMLREHVEKGDPRDVANFCMFLWALRSPISAAPSPEAPTTDAIAKQDPVALYAHENLCTIKNELAALIADPANPTVDQWPCLNPADRECLQKAYTTIRGMTGTQYTNPAPSPKTAPSDDRIDEEWFYVMDMKIPMVERARIFARAILRASESK